MDMKEGWEYKKLGEVAYYPTNRISANMVDENNYVGVDNLIKDRGGKNTAITFPEDGNCIEYNDGDVLIGNIRPYLKKIWLANMTGGASGDVLILRPNNKDLLCSNYLYWCLANDSFFEYDMVHSKGAKMPRGSKTDILKYIIPVPPYFLQQRIASELDLLNGIIEKEKAQLEELDKLAQSIFYDMFGDPVTNEKRWNVRKLEDIASSKIGLTYKPSDICDDGIIVLRSSNIQNSHLDFKDVVRVNCNIKPNQWVQDGDILMCSRNGSFKLVGKVAMIENLTERMSYGAFMTIIRSEYNSYLFAFFKSPAFRNQLGCAGTATINQITVKMLNDIRIPLPPLSLQKEFADKISVVEAMKAKVRQSLAEAEQLFNSRMDYYFN